MSGTDDQSDFDLGETWRREGESLSLLGDIDPEEAGGLAAYAAEQQRQRVEGPRTHEPDGYSCPFCLLQQGVHNDHNRPDDVVAVTEHAFARISPRWWPRNDGGVLVIPRAHHENLYDLPADVGHAVWDLTQQVAVAMRDTYRCEGISTRQHNEPSGDQDVWHLHVHVLPRFLGDRLYEQHARARFAPPEERRPHADRLAAALGQPRTFD